MTTSAFPPKSFEAPRKPKDSKRQKQKEWPQYTMTELESHNTPDDLWIAVEGKVYNVTKFVNLHPGGDLPILGLGGKDATDPMLGFHPPYVLDSMLPPYQVGEILDYKVTPLSVEFRALRQVFKEKGYYKPQPNQYYMKLAWYSVLFGAGLALTAGWLGQAMWLRMLGAVCFGIFWQQTAFLGHDAGHNSITQTRAGDRLFGMLVTCFFGVSGMWWKRNHNTHHVLTNSIDYDPDIQHLPVLAVSRKLFDGFFSTYYKKQFNFDSIAQLIVAHQHNLYVPVMLVARWNLHLQSLLCLLDPRQKGITLKERVQDLAAMAVYGWYVSSIVSMVPGAWYKFAWIMLAHACAGLIHVQITLSHFAMESYMGPGYDKDEADFWIKNQLRTSLDVLCPKWLDWFHGGLQFQVVHHIWPHVQRHKLREVRDKYLLPLCQKHGLKYTAFTWFEAISFTYRKLREEAFAARKFPNASLKDSKIVDLLFAFG